MANPLRKTMVYLGLADEELDYEDSAPAAPVAPVAPVAYAVPQSTNRAPVTPLRRPTTTRNAAPVAESFRDGIPVIINLSQMSEPDARRLVDFASGLSLGLYGKIERVTNKVFLLSPAHVAVSGEQSEAESDVDAAFFPES
jgi:cell division inhibitor SepF